jgi:hypothetical protein
MPSDGPSGIVVEIEKQLLTFWVLEHPWKSFQAHLLLGNCLYVRGYLFPIYACRFFLLGDRPMKVSFQMLASLLNKFSRFSSFKLK